VEARLLSLGAFTMVPETGDECFVVLVDVTFQNRIP
jgi:hypothetical protein